MGRNYLAIASLTFSLLAVPCYGQVALDRVDPGRAEERVTNEREEIPTTSDIKTAIKLIFNYFLILTIISE